MDATGELAQFGDGLLEIAGGSVEQRVSMRCDFTVESGPDASQCHREREQSLLRTVMQVTFDTRPFAQIESDALVTYIFEESDPVQGRVAEIDTAAGGLLKKIAASGEVSGKTLEFTLIHVPTGLKAARLLLVGAGKRPQFNGAVLRKVAGAGLRYLKSRSIKNFVFLAREEAANTDTAQALAEGFITANFETDKYKTEKKNGKEIESVRIAGYSESEKSAGEKGDAAPWHR